MNEFRLDSLTVEGRKVHFDGTIHNNLINRTYNISGDINNSIVDSTIDENGKINISIEPLVDVLSTNKRSFNITVINEEVG